MEPSRMGIRGIQSRALPYPVVVIRWLAGHADWARWLNTSPSRKRTCGESPILPDPRNTPELDPFLQKAQGFQRR